MAADLTLIDATLRTRVLALIDRCRSRGFEMRPSAGLRDPFEQARLWRQSRAIEEIRTQIASLRTSGANFLAHCLESVGPQHGDPVTNALPGYSWHQWGEAVDCFWLLDDRAEWSTTRTVNGENAYKVYAREATDLGLTAGGLWARLKDWPHVQLRKASSPSTLGAVEIDRVMQERFGGQDL
jgi:peptidoglycan LD-endopeptidase CwlK